MIIFLSGHNQYALKQYLARQASIFVEKNGPDSLKIIAGQDATLSEIGLALNTGSLFSQKRMVVVENIFSNKKASLLNDLYKYLEDKKIDDSVDIIIFTSEKTDFKGLEKKFFDYLSAQKYSKAFPALKLEELNAWAKRELLDKKVKIATGAFQELLNRCGLDQWQLHNEIEKLAAYKKEVTTKDIKELVSPKHDENIFALSDALSARNKRTATEILQELLAADLEADYIITMVYKHLRNLINIKSLLEDGNSEAGIVASTKLHPYVVKKSLGAARSFPREKLVEMLNKLMQIEQKARSGQGELEKDLAVLIANI